MRIAIPQQNYRTGDIRKNCELMLEAIRKARTEQADLIVFPELAVCGPLPQDLLEQEGFVTECRETVERLADACGSMAAIIGAPNLDPANGIMYNSAYFIQNGEVADGVHKTVLSDYDVFDESRYFVAGEENMPIRFRNKNIRILFDEYESEFIDKGDSLVICIGSTPFTTESLSYRKQVLGALSKRHSKTIVSVHPATAATSVLFDGNSMIYNYKGEAVLHLKAFEEDFAVVEIDRVQHYPLLKQEKTDPVALIHRALVFGVRDYFRKNGFTQAVVGLSGGLDSAVVAALAAEAIGAENTTGLLMPSGFSSDHSVTDAEALAKNLGMPVHTLPIQDIYERYLATLDTLFYQRPFNVAEENLQARIRGNLVMAVSNKFGHIVLNTSNKSEAAVGYGTLYGDLCGSLAVLCDVYKTDVYKLARYINRDTEIIPEHTLTKVPSAELRPGQKDRDSLPEYDVLDGILKLYLEERHSAREIVLRGFEKETVEKVVSMVIRNEYKRYQCPPGIKISKKAFGNGRRFPL
ncbi:MAG: NAD+ synthase [Culturomica sp.]|jgi:NAD+ synthase (glutamine-hydrolysing)|nr:NAD+ synthase [Culturomica sp.]